MVFGFRYEKSCQISKQTLLEWAYNPDRQLFYDLFVPYKDTATSTSKLHPVPMLVTNRGDFNRKEDENNWRLTSRFFLVDALSGLSITKKQKAATEAGGPTLPEFIRYTAKSSYQSAARG